MGMGVWEWGNYKLGSLPIIITQIWTPWEQGSVVYEILTWCSSPTPSVDELKRLRSEAFGAETTAGIAFNFYHKLPQ